MNSQAEFDTFAESAFGLDPGGKVGRRLEAMATQYSLPKGEIAQLDRSQDEIVYVASGATKLSALVSTDREQIVAFHFAGDVVSIPSVGIHSYVMTGLTESRLLVFPALEFFDSAAGESPIARFLLERLPAALHRCRDKAVALGRKSASERLAGFLVGMAERIGRTNGNQCTLDLPMSRRDIGDSLGLTIETVSRQLSLMREANLIETHGRSQITLRDLEGLVRRAGHASDNQNSFVKESKFDLDQCASRARQLAG